VERATLAGTGGGGGGESYQHAAAAAACVRRLQELRVATSHSGRSTLQQQQQSTAAAHTFLVVAAAPAIRLPTLPKRDNCTWTECMRAAVCKKMAAAAAAGSAAHAMSESRLTAAPSTRCLLPFMVGGLSSFGMQLGCEYSYGDY
jgi:hypothetical protein